MGKPAATDRPRLTPLSPSFTLDVIVGNSSGECVVHGFNLAVRQHEIVADGRVDVGVVPCGQSILRGQTVQVWHGGIANHLPIAVVLFHHQEDMG